MIILIGGGTHTGKTALAQKLLEKYKYPYVSIDHLKMALIHSGICNLSPESPDSELTSYLWNIVREMIKTTIENEQNLIIEGIYIPFDYKNDFEERYNRHVKYLCIIFSERYINENFEIIIKTGSIIEKRKEDGGLRKEEIIAENKLNLAECMRVGLDYILVDEKYDINAKVYEKLNIKNL